MAGYVVLRLSPLGYQDAIVVYLVEMSKYIC
jgi:hypothetical protein